MQGWLTYYFQGSRHPLSLSLPVWLEWKPQLRKLVQGWPRAFWPLLLRSQPTQRAGTRALRNNTHIPKSSTGYAQSPALGQQGSTPTHRIPHPGNEPVPSSRGGASLNRYTSFRLDFLLHHHPLGSYRSESTGRFSPTSKQPAVRSPSHPAQHPCCKMLRVPARARGHSHSPPRQQAPLPELVLRHLYRRCGAARPAPRAAQGEQGAGAGAAQEGGWMPARRWAAWRTKSFLWSLSQG